MTPLVVVESGDPTRVASVGISERRRLRLLSCFGPPKGTSFLQPKREMAIEPFIGLVMKGEPPYPSSSVS